MAQQSPCSVSVVIATAFRDATLKNTLRSLAAQSRLPEEIVIVDGAPAPGVEEVVEACRRELGLNVVYGRTKPPSAAVQRNLGVDKASGDVILFLDDDAYPEPDCLAKMIRVFEEDSTSRVGGVGVLIRNQLCPPPSPRAKLWFDFLADERRESYSGMIIGPAIAIGPEPTNNGDIVRVEWLSSTCTAYRRLALPQGVFDSRFHGYSYMEDVDLSVRVARRFDLVVHTGAYIFHDTQPSQFKRPYLRAKMVVENRYYVMTTTLGRNTASHHFRFLASLAVNQMTSLRDVRRPRDLVQWFQTLGGTIRGLMAFPSL